MKEFELIARYFQQPTLSWCNEIISTSIGDDCAVLNIPDDQELCVSMDTLVEDVHFPKQANPYDIATRALCVTLSDLAAMGATPIGFTLAITLPSANEAWLKSFSDGLIEIAQKYQCSLMGGDTTKGPVLVISIQVHGIVKKGCALKRSDACVGDKVYVSGNIGDGAGALPFVLQDPCLQTELTARYYKPFPQVEYGQSLIGVASACLDISDGLIQDLNHICKSSSVGMMIDSRKIPLSEALLQEYSKHQALEYALIGGDDYQLAYTAKHCVKGLCIGEVVSGSEVLVPGREAKKNGFQHF